VELQRPTPAGKDAAMAGRRRARTEELEAPEALPALASRLVYSLLKSAARVAARARLPMGQLLDLAQLAYFEEVRAQHPTDLSRVADDLGVSLRTVGTLNRRRRLSFFAPESEVQPARRISAILLDGAKTLAEIRRAAPELAAEQVRQALRFLHAQGWISSADRRYALRGRLRSYIDETLTRRIDALNNQMEIMAESVWRSFVEGDGATAVGRSWSFAARAEELAAFADRTIRELRHGAIDLEESALRSDGAARFGVTIAFAKVGEEPK
jgi:hypothetical protein